MTTDRKTVTLTLKPEPGVELHAGLKPVLKALVRRYGLRCVSARMNPTNDPAPPVWPSGSA